MRAFFRDNGLSLVLGATFLALLAGQSVTGYHTYNDEQQAHGAATASYAGYLATPHFGEAVFENWESEFFQMAAYVLLTAFLFQRGSAESNDPDEPQESVDAHRADPAAPAPVRRGGWRLALYRHSLSLALGTLFLGSFVGHAVTGAAEYNEEQAEHGEPPVTVGEYMRGARFWFESLQNWQSEFLAVLAIVVLTIRLREDGSPESKPVWKPHRATGAE